MSVAALEDEAGADITHFAHRDEFLRLLAAFLEGLEDGPELELDRMVKEMGAIVSLCNGQ